MEKEAVKLAEDQRMDASDVGETTTRASAPTKALEIGGEIKAMERDKLKIKTLEEDSEV